MFWCIPLFDHKQIISSLACTEKRQESFEIVRFKVQYIHYFIICGKFEKQPLGRLMPKYVI